MHPQAQVTETQAVIIVQKELRKMKTNGKEVSYRFSTIVLLSQLFYNDNNEPVDVKIKGDELKNRLQNKAKALRVRIVCGVKILTLFRVYVCLAPKLASEGSA